MATTAVRPDFRKLALSQAAGWLSCWGPVGARVRVDMAVGRWPRDALDAAVDLIDRFEAAGARTTGNRPSPRGSGPTGRCTAPKECRLEASPMVGGSGDARERHP